MVEIDGIWNSNEFIKRESKRKRKAKISDLKCTAFVWFFFIFGKTLKLIVKLFQNIYDLIRYLWSLSYV